MNVDEEKEAEIDTKYKVDGWQTLFSNIPWALHLVVLAGIILILFRQINTLENEVNKLLAIVICAFVTVKIVSWTSHPHIHYKSR